MTGGWPVWPPLRRGAGVLREASARFNSGSEHLLAWCLEERTGRRLLHGEIVSLGILIMAHMQGHDPEQDGLAARFDQARAFVETLG